MLTVKIISTDKDGIVNTSLFAAERVSHGRHDFNKDLSVKDTKSTFSDGVIHGSGINYIIGGLSNYETTQAMQYATVTLWNKDETEVICVTPLSEVYVMQDGKTVDSFSVRFYQK